MAQIIEGCFKNNGEYNEDDKYTPILNNGAVVGFIKSVEKENVNIILWEKCISKEYLYSPSKKILCSISFG